MAMSCSLLSTKHSLSHFFPQQYFDRCSQEQLFETLKVPSPLCKERALWRHTILLNHNNVPLKEEATSGRDIVREKRQLIAGFWEAAVLMARCAWLGCQREGGAL